MIVKALLEVGTMNIIRSAYAAAVCTGCLMLAGCISLTGNAERANAGVWSDCVLTAARHSATDPGTPAQVADAAFAACKTQEADFTNKVQIYYPGASTNISAWKDDIRQRAVSVVIEIRSGQEESSGSPQPSSSGKQASK